jgi:hypothetical protein
MMNDLCFRALCCRRASFDQLCLDRRFKPANPKIGRIWHCETANPLARQCSCVFSFRSIFVDYEKRLGTLVWPGAGALRGRSTRFARRTLDLNDCSVQNRSDQVLEALRSNWLERAEIDRISRPLGERPQK